MGNRFVRNIYSTTFSVKTQFDFVGLGYCWRPSIIFVILLLYDTSGMEPRLQSSYILHQFDLTYYYFYNYNTQLSFEFWNITLLLSRKEEKEKKIRTTSIKIFNKFCNQLRRWLNCSMIYLLCKHLISFSVISGDVFLTHSQIRVHNSSIVIGLVLHYIFYIFLQHNSRGVKSVSRVGRSII